MKKISAFLFTFIIIVSSLFISVSAQNTATISEDFSHLYFKSYSYSKYNPNLADVEPYANYDFCSIELSEEQKKTISSISVDFSEDYMIASVYVDYLDGTSSTIPFLNDKYLDEYQKFVNSTDDSLQIDFEYPEDNQINVTKTQLFGERYNFYSKDIKYNNRYDVNMVSDSGNFYKQAGILLICEDGYYYADFEESQVEADDVYYLEDYDDYLICYKITDEELIEQIEDSNEDYYDGDMGFLINDDFTDTVSDVFLIIAFAIIPFVIFVCGLIFALRSKTVYKKFFTVTYILAALELAIFSIIIIVVC